MVAPGDDAAIGVDDSGLSILPELPEGDLTRGGDTVFRALRITFADNRAARGDGGGLALAFGGWETGQLQRETSANLTGAAFLRNAVTGGSGGGAAFRDSAVAVADTLVAENSARSGSARAHSVPGADLQLNARRAPVATCLQ